MKIKYNKIDWFGIITELIFIIFAIIVIVQFIMKIIGGSPTETRMLYFIFSTFLTYFFRSNYKFGQIDNSLLIIKDDIREIKGMSRENSKDINNKFYKVEERLTKIENKIS